MKTSKRSVFQFVAGAFIGSALLAACNDDQLPANGTVVLKMEATSGTGTGTTINGRVAATTVITDFKINVKEIEFEFDKADSHFATDSSYNSIDDIKLKGPFVLDLLQQNAFVEQIITTANLPNALFEEVEFKLHKNTDASAGVMLGKSILMSGTIDGKPFIFWHDTNEEFEIDFADPATDLVVNGTTKPMVINMHLDQLFSTIKGGVNLSLAKDGDGDGTIEINPGSTDNDGNKDLANAIKNLLEHATDLIDDKD